MNSQHRVVSLPELRLHLSASPSRRCQLSHATQPLAHSENHNGRLNAAIFERLLHWLGPDSHSAGRKYESIRTRLIAMFRARQCVFAEDLADDTFERVAQRLASITSQFTGDPARYFYGVAKKIYLEYVRQLKTTKLRTTRFEQATFNDPNSEHTFELLEKALNMIPNSDRELILTYYAWNGKRKIEHRRAIAKQLGIELNTLRLRVFRIRREIKKKMLQLDENS